ncbi:hypothetical protein KP509_1Z108500 [Ceratopteris richardii]|nr:hypothetical protein KP509_1Z108500 [Ceratopteris richardii]
MATQCSPSIFLRFKVIIPLLCLLSIGDMSCSAKSNSKTSNGLQYGFYKHSCPRAELIVHQGVRKAVVEEARMAASLLRLHFHDCFVQGCDGSLLLKTVSGVIESEQEAAPNLNSVRGFDVIDSIKAALESECPGVVSCADILAMAARDSIAVGGGPQYSVLLGRLDSRTANKALANKNLPGFNFNVSDLVASFANVGLSAQDMVALSGGHTIGKAGCDKFAERLTPNSDDPAPLDSSYRKYLSQLCPDGANTETDVNLDVKTPIRFDNAYYSNLLKNRGLLHSDQVLYSTPGFSHDQVLRYAHSNQAWFSDFVRSMTKMGSLDPITAYDQGEIRKNCGYIN